MNDFEKREKPPATGFGWICSGLLTERDARNLLVFIAWLLAWCLAFAGSTILISMGILPPSVGYILTAATLGLGIVSISRYVRFLRDADELLRKIQLEALAIGFGGGAVFTLAWRLLEQMGAPIIPGSGLIAIMFMIWAVGQRMGIVKYTSD